MVFTQQKHLIVSLAWFYSCILVFFLEIIWSCMSALTINCIMDVKHTWMAIQESSFIISANMWLSGHMIRIRELVIVFTWNESSQLWHWRDRVDMLLLIWISRAKALTHPKGSSNEFLQKSCVSNFLFYYIIEKKLWKMESIAQNQTIFENNWALGQAYILQWD